MKGERATRSSSLAIAADKQNRNTQRTTVRVRLPEQSQGRSRLKDFKGGKSDLPECFFVHFAQRCRRPWNEACTGQTPMPCLRPF